MNTLKPIVVAVFGAIIMFASMYAGLMGVAFVGFCFAMAGLGWLFGIALNEQ